MATTYTENFNLGKQENRPDKFDMSVITKNMDIIDETMQGLLDNITEHDADQSIHVTAEDKNKLSELENYDDTEVRAEIAQITESAPYRLASWDGEIAEGDDLNAYITPGTYKAGGATVTASLSNKPAELSAGFKLRVEYVFHASHIFQTIIAQTGEIYVRRINRSANLYGDWQQLVTDNGLDSLKTDVTTIASQAATNKATLGYQRKNLLKNTAVSRTINGVTFTVGDDGSVTANGTNDKNYMTEFNVGKITLKKGNYTISTNVPGGQAGNTALRVINEESSEYITITSSDEYLELSATTTFDAKIVVYSSKSVVNVTFRPMIRYADITDNTYEPYKPSIEERLTALEEVIHNGI